MTKQTRKQDAQKDTKSPTHALFHIEERGADSKAFWTEVAVGWENQDGSVNLRTGVGAILIPGHVYQLRVRPTKNGDCCCRRKVDQPCRLKTDQGWRPRAVALGVFGL